MAEIDLVFELKGNKSITDVARSVQDRIAKMDIVKEVEAVVETPDQMRALGGTEIIAAIGVTVLMVRSGREVVEEVRKFVQDLKGLMGDINDLKNIYIDIRKRRIPLHKLRP